MLRHGLRGRVGWCAMWMVLSAWGVAAFSGCGNGGRPPLGRVGGKVLMDGKPLAGVIVTFKPTVGRPSVGTTDGEGNYELEYRYRVKGAKVGPNEIGFSWPIGTTGKPMIPVRYTGKTELSCEVKSGRNRFDFELESDGGNAQANASPPAEE